MGWAEDKAREMMADPETRATLVMIGPRATAAVVERAIRETIEKCADTAADCMSVEGAVEHIRKLLDP